MPNRQVVDRYKEWKDDFPDFRPNLTPYEIFKQGAMGGTYFREIESKITGKTHKNQHKKYIKKYKWDISEDMLSLPCDEYNKDINKYRVRVGVDPKRECGLRYWEEAGWIEPIHPYGWIQWYIEFYYGKRSYDDERQIDRWNRTAGPNSRFRRRLINMISQKRAGYNDPNISPKIRQTLHHWGYVLTNKDFNE